jgi:hypothetical protein
MTGQLTTQEAKRQQVQQSSQHARDVETQEHHAKASASVRTHLSHPSYINAQENYSRFLFIHLPSHPQVRIPY